jgi:hypothetical protein
VQAIQDRLVNPRIRRVAQLCGRAGHSQFTHPMLLQEITQRWCSSGRQDNRLYMADCDVLLAKENGRENRLSNECRICPMSFCLNDHHRSPS